MWVLLLAYLAAFGDATILGSEESFDEKLEDGFDLLRSDPNAYDTMKFRRRAHEMQQRTYTDYEEPSEEVAKAMELYAESTRGHEGAFVEDVNSDKKVGIALFQGDMMLSKAQADEILEDMEVYMGSRRKRQAYYDHKYPATLWSNGINYAFWNASNPARRVFTKATKIWSEDTCLEFREDNSATDKVWVTDGAGCWSHVGRLGGTQFMSLGDGCGYIGLGLHELGHTIGLWHTQSRHDRDDFISMRWENLMYDWHDQFGKETESTNYNYNITYDYGTVMHYSAVSPHLSTNGQPYMIPHDNKFLPTLGSYILSFYEKLMVNLHYKCLDKCPKESFDKCANGGFPHPRDCSKCVCPSGYGGRLCKQRPPGCGKELTATEEWQEFQDTVGQENYDRYASNDEFLFCNYWIKAPRGRKIEVIFKNYSADNLGVGGCQWAGVEIKTLKDKRHTGYRFCSAEYIGTSFVSTHDIVPIIHFSRVYKVTTTIRYRIHPDGGRPTKPTTERPLQPETAIEPETTTTEPTTQPSSKKTPPPTSKPNKCLDVLLCNVLKKLGFCKVSDIKPEFKAKVCPGVCN